MSIEELLKQKNEIEEKIKAEKQRVYDEEYNSVIEKINSFTYEEKEIILKHIEHDRTSCSDDNPCNGYSCYNERFRCRKCMLMEILNHKHGGCFDFDITVDITRIDEPEDE